MLRTPWRNLIIGCWFLLPAFRAIFRMIFLGDSPLASVAIRWLGLLGSARAADLPHVRTPCASKNVPHAQPMAFSALLAVVTLTMMHHARHPARRLRRSPTSTPTSSQSKLNGRFSRSSSFSSSAVSASGSSCSSATASSAASHCLPTPPSPNQKPSWSANHFPPKAARGAIKAPALFNPPQQPRHNPIPLYSPAVPRPSPSNKLTAKS